MSIRTKLFFLVLVAFSVLILATSWQIGEQANKVSMRAIERSLAQSSVVVTTNIDSRFTSIKEVATGIARDSRVLPLVFDSESLTLQDLSLEFKRVLEFDVLFFTNAAGVILARSDRPNAIGQPLAGKSTLFDQPLAGKATQGVIASRGKLLQIVVIPIFDNIAPDLVRGTVALAYEFSPEMAQEINALTASDIGFFTFTRDEERKVNGVQSTYNTNGPLETKLQQLFSQNPEQWQSIYTSKTALQEVHLRIGNEDFFAIVHRLANDNGNPLGFVLAARSRTEIIKPYLDIQRTVILIGFACLIGASIFAWVFSLRISRPIIKLVSVTQKIQEGDFKSLEENPASNDEVGQLYRAVMTMGKNLRDKAELENYLAQMSDELDISESIPLGNDSFDDAPSPTNTHLRLDNDLPLEEDESTQPHTSIQSEKGDEKTEPHSHHDATRASSPSASQNEYHHLRDGEVISSIIDKRYDIIRHIGAGAMGTVYLAHDMALDENVAIKIMPKNFFSEKQSVNFKEEIRLARQVTHRNILRTFDFGDWKNYYYITMEYVSGYDLGKLLKTRGAFEPHIGLIMARQICSAMHAAHEQGIIHRDLKPSNMMINRQGILKIMDFGLAMRVNKGEEAQGDGKARKSAHIAGTPRYMAPEQFYNWPLDERTDIYAIGIILYAIFSGAPPFSHKNIEKLAEMHLKDAPPPITGKRGYFPDTLQRLVNRALAKKPEDRYQSVRQILDDLNAYSND